MRQNTARCIAAASMAGAATLAIAGFTALGSIFDYPAVLEAPTADVLAAYREHQTSITGWFLALVVSAALLGPIGFLLGRIAGGRLGTPISLLGIAAATVQVIGLSRWVLFVPGISKDAASPTPTGAAAKHMFERLHFWLGTIIGETVGYALTAAFTLLVVIAFRNASHTSRWIGVLGYASAALIAVGVTIPLGIPAADLANFVGYVAWCGWLIVMAVVLWRSRGSGSPSPAFAAANNTGTAAADRVEAGDGTAQAR